MSAPANRPSAVSSDLGWAGARPSPWPSRSERVMSLERGDPRSERCSLADETAARRGFRARRARVFAGGVTGRGGGG